MCRTDRYVLFVLCHALSGTEWTAINTRLPVLFWDVHDLMIYLLFKIVWIAKT